MDTRSVRDKPMIYDYDLDLGLLDTLSHYALPFCEKLD